MPKTVYEKILQDIGQNMPAKIFEKIKENTKNRVFLYEVTLYQLYIINPNGDGLTNKLILSIKNTIRNQLKKYPHVRVLIVESTTDRRNAHRVKKKINGRYRTVIEGSKVPLHVHICAVGSCQRR